MSPLQFYVYIFLCERGKRYCGWTSHVVNRFTSHLTGKGAKFTTGFPPVKLLHLESVANQSVAKVREIELKRMMRKRKPIEYSIAREYQGVFEIIQTELLWQSGPWVKRKLNAIERGGTDEPGTERQVAPTYQGGTGPEDGEEIHEQGLQ